MAVPNRCAGPFGAAYSFWIERERLARIVGRALWGIDVRPMYRSMGRIGEEPSGSTIVDVPCGSGVALRALRPEQRVRYLAIDIDDAMLGRTRTRAAGRAQIETLRGDMRALPLEDGLADLVCCFSGLHMIERPCDAVTELSRILRPGGSLIGSTFLRGGTRRQEMLIAIEQRRGGAPQPFAAHELRAWLAEAGLHEAHVGEGGFAVFSARKPPA
ncbi:MAG: class I SAM-dependent methyltransferase [Solirubrobacteraceae bacterium]|nr:class I SAM-dependent methyltransferase [Solirubrobacteraceae bacterium]